MKTIALTSLTLLFLSFTLVAEAESSQFEKQKLINWEVAKVKSPEQIQVELEDENSPLYLLSNQGRKEFLDSIVFREAGLGGYSYRPLEEELTPTEIYKVLSLFGAQHTVYFSKNARVESATDLILLEEPHKKPLNETLDSGGEFVLPGEDDHEGYSCLKKATCEVTTNQICMSTC